MILVARFAPYLEQIIADVIEMRGIKVSSGGPGQRPANATFVVTYQDRWSWDMRTYLPDISIEERGVHRGSGDGRSSSIFSLGDSDDIHR